MDTTQVDIPQTVDPAYLIQQAAEVEGLLQQLNQAEIEWENVFFQAYENQTSGGADPTSRQIQATIWCRENHPDLFNTYEALKIRVAGLKLKTSLVGSAFKSYSLMHDMIDSDHPMHSLSTSSGVS